MGDVDPGSDQQGIMLAFGAGGSTAVEGATAFGAGGSTAV